MNIFKWLLGLERKQKFKRGINVSIKKSSKIGIDCEIGSYTYIGNNSSVTRAIIGRYVSIGDNVSIGPGEHPVDRISTNHNFIENEYQQLTQKDCIIGNDVWIGVNSVVRRGVKVGNGVVIGANSFVNKDVPDFAIVAGSPAKLIRYRFSDEIIKEINKSKWWEKDAKEAKKIVKDLEERLLITAKV